MYDFSKVISDASTLFSKTLTIGNHDSVTLFGIEPQNRLKDYSTKVSKLLRKDMEMLDIVILDAISEVEIFETKVSTGKKMLFGVDRQRRVLAKEYDKLFSYIEKITSYFYLQQAQLMKEIKYLERLKETVYDCSNELQACIEYGKTILEERTSCRKDIENDMFSVIVEDDDFWFSRLEKRINDLSISYVVSLQNQAQINMLIQNNLSILDRISSAISNVFPIWKNQMAILLGIVLLEKRLETQENLAKSAEDHLKVAAEGAAKKRTHCNVHNLNKKNIVELNCLLKNALCEMSQLNKTDGDIRKGFQKTE